MHGHWTKALRLHCEIAYDILGIVQFLLAIADIKCWPDVQYRRRRMHCRPVTEAIDQACAGMRGTRKIDSDGASTFLSVRLSVLP